MGDSLTQIADDLVTLTPDALDRLERRVDRFIAQYTRCASSRAVDI
jgi:hypothetical protein